MPEMMKMDHGRIEYAPCCEHCKPNDEWHTKYGEKDKHGNVCTLCLPARPAAKAASPPRLTERQERRLIEVIKEIEDRWGVHLNLHRIDKTFAEETRPGRGHDLTWVAYEEDRFFQGTVDVYGNGTYGVTERVEWACTGNEFCECPHCKAEREGEDFEEFLAQVEAQER